MLLCVFQSSQQHQRTLNIRKTVLFQKQDIFDLLVLQTIKIKNKNGKHKSNMIFSPC